MAGIRIILHNFCFHTLPSNSMFKLQFRKRKRSKSVRKLTLKNGNERVLPETKNPRNRLLAWI